MDAIEFAKTVRKICRSHTSCVECEFIKVQGHCGITNPEADHAGMVAVAEQWAREHVEGGTEEESRNVLELMVALTEKVDRLAERITRYEQAIHATSSACAGGETEREKKKRTHKEVLLAAFPYFEMSNGMEHSVFACPISFDTRHKCDKDKKCVDCKREYWLAEVEE